MEWSRLGRLHGRGGTETVFRVSVGCGEAEGRHYHTEVKIQGDRNKVSRTSCLKVCVREAWEITQGVVTFRAM